MNPLQRALIEKIGVDNGFEHTLSSDEHDITLASARHPARSTIAVPGTGFCVRFTSDSPALLPELMRGFPEAVRENGEFVVAREAALALLLRRAANLSRVLPNQAATLYRQALDEELSALPRGLRGTEVERVVGRTG